MHALLRDADTSAGVPVELRVAATLRAISPLLPMPVTTTRPVHPYSKSMARSKSAAIGTGDSVSQRAQRVGFDSHDIFGDVLHERYDVGATARERAMPASE